MSKLFETSEINGLKLSNRFVRSATWEAMATDTGECTPVLVDLMAGLARGGVGLIISGHTYIRAEGKAGPGQLAVYQDDLITGLQKMTAAVHENDGKIVMQLAHAGLTADPKITGKTSLAPSNADGLAASPCREMTAADIQDVVDAFAAGAKRARIAGFDGVQIHGAHGYLLSQFLSPFYNRRRDEYGGSIQNRARALLEVLGAIREAVGPDYPILAKMNCRDFHDNGLSLEDSIQAGVMLADEGIDAIEISGGNQKSGTLGAVRRGIKSDEKEAYFQNEAGAFKEKVNVPLILVGGNSSFQVAERLVNEGVTDYISMSRPLIREPDLIGRWQAGDRRRAACKSDNLCFGPARKGEGIYCVTEERERKNLLSVGQKGNI
jgi:2,4-dienoyl-CoA reductase-like NADH-dependent reductase (Old Yellow Enzyme family)